MSGEGLPTRKITIDLEDLRRLESDVWSNEFAPVKLEMNGVVMDAKLRFRGGHTRNYPKKSYEIHYGYNRILHWNAEFDDPSMIRNALSFQFFNLMGVPSPKTKHMWLEWNGNPHGCYLELESVDSKFFRKRGIGARSLIYAVNDKANFSTIDPYTDSEKETMFEGYRVMKGTDYTRTKLIRFVKRINRPANSSLRTYLANRLDVYLYLKWLAGAVLTGNYDGFDQNYALYEHTSTGRYRIIPWDYEGTWGRNCYGKLCGSDLVDVKGYNTLTWKVLSYKSCRQAYRKILSNMLATKFTVETIEPMIANLYEKLGPAIRDDFTRKWPYYAFEQEPQTFLDYIEERRAIVQEVLDTWKD
ncbi:CotH kinase family protein [Paenibacillus albus]|uniref:Spore coat protein CotH n=1 Tax=Paenibacillus albus TaxID=2495582 RepID=A0A3Q8X8F6_9BACL|nr:CotH kinase family protein [Paenibacillus albus]AZN42845.1 spore coat protein CotH [Paenibacillus albus]